MRYCLLALLYLLMPHRLEGQSWDPKAEALDILRFQGSRALDLAQLRISDRWLSEEPLYQGLWLRESGASDSVVFDFLPFASAPRAKNGTALAYDLGTGSRMWTGFTEGEPVSTAAVGAAAQAVLRLWDQFSSFVSPSPPLLNHSQCPGMRLRLGSEMLQEFGTDGRDVPPDTRAFIIYADCQRELGGSWQLATGIRAYDWRTPGLPDRQDVETGVRIARLPRGEGLRIFADASWTPEYQRAVLHLERPFTVRRLQLRPFLRLAWGEKLPFGLGFWPGGLDGFPGFKAGEGRGDREVTAAVDIIQPVWGKLSVRAMGAVGRTADGGSLVSRGPWLAGLRAGLNLDTRRGLFRLEYGVSGGYHRAFLIRLGRIL
jgi:hypothetical protein